MKNGCVGLRPCRKSPAAGAFLADALCAQSPGVLDGELDEAQHQHAQQKHPAADALGGNPGEHNDSCKQKQRREEHAKAQGQALELAGDGGGSANG